LLPANQYKTDSHKQSIRDKRPKDERNPRTVAQEQTRRHEFRKMFRVNVTRIINKIIIFFLLFQNFKPCGAKFITDLALPGEYLKTMQNIGGVT